MELRLPLAQLGPRSGPEPRPESASESGVDSLAVCLDEPEKTSDLAVLYLHGFGSSQAGEKADLFRARFLARGIAFCSFDFQGHGESDGWMFDLTLSRNVADVELVHTELKRRGYQRVVLFGSSMGGLTGLWYAARHPQAVHAAIHLAPALGLEETFSAELGTDKVERWQREGKLEIGHDLGAWDIGWNFVEDLRAHDVATLCAHYRTPTLIFQGKHDTSVPWRQVVEFAAQSAGEEIELHLFADGDHRMLDRLQRLWLLTEEFLVGRGLTPS